MKTILIINGETYWPDYFAGYHIVQKKIQNVECVVKDSSLYFIDADGTCKPDITDLMTRRLLKKKCRKTDLFLPGKCSGFLTSKKHSSWTSV